MAMEVHSVCGLNLIPFFCSVRIWYWIETNGPWGNLSWVTLEGKIEGRDVFLETESIPILRFTSVL